MGGEGRASEHDTTYDPLVEQNRGQVGPTILFECPAQIPRSSLRSFSLWSRHSAETSAHSFPTRRSSDLFPVASRRCEGEEAAGGNEWARRVERPYAIQRHVSWVSRTAVGWGPQFSSSAPPRSPAPPFDHFPFGPAILRRRVPSGTYARVRRNFSPWPAGRCEGEEAAEGRK